MLNWIRSVYEKFTEVLVWLWLLASVIFGISIGTVSGMGAFVGVIVGLVVGLISAVLFFGCIAEFLSMGRDIKALRKDVEEIKNKSN